LSPPFTAFSSPPFRHVTAFSSPPFLCKGFWIGNELTPWLSGWLPRHCPPELPAKRVFEQKTAFEQLQVHRLAAMGNLPKTRLCRHIVRIGVTSRKGM
jgi:hypothetical protein